jgi:hypothetical protein
MALIIRTLKGQERLTVVFWGYCITGTLVVGVLLFWAARLFPAPRRTLGDLVTGAANFGGPPGIQRVF